MAIDFALINQPRTRAVLRQIATGENALMSCAEQRVASTLYHRGYLHVADSARREFSIGYLLTDRGREAVATVLPTVTLSNENKP